MRLFFLKLFPLDLPERQLFLVKENLLSSKSFFTWNVTCINITKKFFFSLLIKLRQRLRCLLYAFLSMPLFVFTNVFLSTDIWEFSSLDGISFLIQRSMPPPLETTFSKYKHRPKHLTNYWPFNLELNAWDIEESW